MTTVRNTQVICPGCRQKHPATVARDAGRIVGRFACGDQDHVAILSEDADLFEKISNKSHVKLSGARTELPTRALVNLIEVTDTCNFACPICFAGCKPLSNPKYATADEVVHKVKQVKRLGARGITLTGGEPTEHPHIEEVIARAKKSGVRVLMVTNGYRLGTEPGFAARLKAAGLYKASIQFDSLEPSVHRLIRGNRYIEEKKRAFRNAHAAGLRLGMIATITHLNIGEIPDLVAFGLGFAPAINTISLQMAADVGRHNLLKGPSVDREKAVRTLLSGPPLANLSEDNFWPLPLFRPWGLHVHPDCGANAYVLTDGQRRGILEDLVDLDKLFARLAQSHRESTLLARNAIPALHALAAARPGKQPALLAHLRGFITGRGRKGLCVVGVGGFARRDFHDQARLDHCATTIATDDGPRSPCAKFYEAEA